MNEVKLIGALSILGLVALASATAWLSALNWSPRLDAPFITAVAVGLVSALFTLAATLEEVTLKDSFVTSVLAYSDGTVPIIVSDDILTSSRLNKLGSLIMSRAQQIQSQRQSFDLFNDTLAATQYYVARLMSEIQGGGFAVSWAGEKIVSSFQEESPLKRPYSLSVNELARFFGPNPFAQHPTEKVYWSFPRYKLPEKTKAELFHVPSSEKTGAEKRGLRFFRKNYFFYEILIEPTAASEGLPDGVTLVGEGQSVPAVIFMKVTITAHFDKLTSGSRATEENKLWSAWLTSQFKRRLDVSE